MNETLIIGVGNEWRGDDGFGCVALEKVRNHLGDRADYLSSRGDVSDLLESFGRYRRIFILDAIESSRDCDQLEMAKLQVLDAHQTHFQSTELRASSHILGVAQAIEIARALGLLPKVVKIFAVEGQSFAMHRGLSPKVEKALDLTVHKIMECF